MVTAARPGRNSYLPSWGTRPGNTTGGVQAPVRGPGALALARPAGAMIGASTADSRLSVRRHVEVLG